MLIYVLVSSQFEFENDIFVFCMDAYSLARYREVSGQIWGERLKDFNLFENSEK